MKAGKLSYVIAGLMLITVTELGYILANPFSSTKLGLAKRVPTRGPNRSFDE